MDTYISAGTYAGGALALAFIIINKPSWYILLAFALGGALFGIALSKIVNKIKSKKKKQKK